MNTVVRRCPNCGVEHDPDHMEPCEVCGTELRFWCQRHSRDVGWLEGQECPVCAREEEERSAAPPPLPPRPAARRPLTSPAGPPLRRDPDAGLREGAREVGHHPTAGAAVMAARAARAIFTLIRSVMLWALLGALAGTAYGFAIGRQVAWLAFFGLYNGAVVGLFLGVFGALRILFSRSPPR